MPLAIELAATWLRVLSPVEIAQEIVSSLDFLSASVRDLPERHRSMRVVFDCSWQRLSARERQVLCQLSVFRGQFSRQAAEQVAGASLPVLSALINRTLLRRAATGGYELHELVRQYRAAHLAADAEAQEATHTRHFRYFLALAEAAGQELKGRDQLEWLGRLEQGHDNLRASLAWALESDRTAPGGGELALRLSGALRWFWRMRGHFHEGLTWLTKSLRQHPGERTVARVGVLLGRGMLAYALGDVGAARLSAEESAEVCRELGDQNRLAEALTLLGLALTWQGQASLTEARLQEALAICRKVGDRWGEARALYRLGVSQMDSAGNPTRRAMLEESIAIFEDLGEKVILNDVLVSFGSIEFDLGEYAAARARLERALAIAREMGPRWGIADALTDLGRVYRAVGDYSTAQSYFEQFLQVYQEQGDSVWGSYVLCALAENAIAQGKLSTARGSLHAASNILETSENKWLQMVVCYCRGLLAHYEGDAVAALRLLEESTALALNGQYKLDLARSLVALGRVRRTLGDPSAASRLLMEGLELLRALGDRLSIAKALEELGAVSAVQGDGVRAAMLFSAAHALREELGAPLPPVDRTDHDAVLAACRNQAGETAFAEAWAHAAATPFLEVVAKVLNPREA